jgi:hypothetical protein
MSVPRLSVWLNALSGWIVWSGAITSQAGVYSSPFKQRLQLAPGACSIRCFNLNLRFHFVSKEAYAAVMSADYQGLREQILGMFLLPGAVCNV